MQSLQRTVEIAIAKSPTELALNSTIINKNNSCKIHDLYDESVAANGSDPACDVNMNVVEVTIAYMKQLVDLEYKMKNVNLARMLQQVKLDQQRAHDSMCKFSEMRDRLNRACNRAIHYQQGCVDARRVVKRIKINAQSIYGDAKDASRMLKPEW
jgi:hypothetical protein